VTAPPPVIVAAADRAKDFSDKPVRVLASRRPPTSWLSTRKRHHDVPGGESRCATKHTAWRVSRRQTSNLGELHDCFTIAEIIALEDLGFVPRGQGGPCSAGGYTARDWAKP